VTDKEREKIQAKCDRALKRAADRIENELGIELDDYHSEPADRKWRGKKQDWQAVTIDFSDVPDDSKQLRGVVFKIIKEEFRKEKIPARFILPEMRFAREKSGAGWGSMGAIEDIDDLDQQAEEYPIEEDWETRHYEGWFGVGMQIRF
jgi:hypothetical protein